MESLQRKFIQDEKLIHLVDLSRQSQMVTFGKVGIKSRISNIVINLVTTV